jgi:dienelactone hydrolase
MTGRTTSVLLLASLIVPCSGDELPLPAARAGHTTKIGPSSYQADGPAPVPTDDYRLVSYRSADGELSAYVSSPPAPEGRRPALIWAHGGFGGIDRRVLRRVAPFRDAGFLVFCPSWRGENANPGRFELFYGEVDDAVAAIEHVAALPGVDRERIYMAGHSTGGTITLLAALSTNKLRAAFSFGGAPDLARTLKAGGYGNTPFDPHDAEETRLRSAIAFVDRLRTPTFYFEGEDSAYPPDAKRMEERAGAAKTPFRAFTLEGGDHFDIVAPLTEYVAAELAKDTGPRLSFAPTHEVVQARFRKGRLKVLDAAIASSADDAELFVKRAWLRSCEGDHRAALADLTRAVELSPSDAEAHFQRALVLEKVGDLAAAIRDYDRVLELTPDDHQAVYNRGILRAGTGDRVGAAQDFERVVKANPQDRDAARNLRLLRPTDRRARRYATEVVLFGLLLIAVSWVIRLRRRRAEDSWPEGERTARR